MAVPVAEFVSRRETDTRLCMPVIDRNHCTVAVAKNACFAAVKRAVLDHGALVERDGFQVNITRDR